MVNLLLGDDGVQCRLGRVLQVKLPVQNDIPLQGARSNWSKFKFDGVNFAAADSIMCYSQLLKKMRKQILS